MDSSTKIVDVRVKTVLRTSLIVLPGMVPIGLGKANHRLPSNICGSLLAQEAFQACDIARSRWLRKYESHNVVWLPLEICYSGPRLRQSISHLWHETSSGSIPREHVACGQLSSSAPAGCARLGSTSNPENLVPTSRSMRGLLNREASRRV
jgi:hypothetical protein